MAERVYCLYRGKDQESILMQKNACHDFAEKKGWNIVGEEQEIGVSGYKVSADDRVKLQRIRKAAEQGGFDILLVFMYDRLGRNLNETPFIAEWFTKKGIHVWSVYKPPGNDFEVYNDFNSLLVNLYRCVRDKPQELMEALRYVLNSREDFDVVRATLARDSPASDVQKAAWFYELIRYSYAAGLTSFGSQPHDMWSNFPLIEQAHRRLAKVVIENKDFEKLIRQYDRPASLFYLDPPYHATEGYYQNIGEDGFTETDHIRLRDALMRIEGKFLLSYNDDEFIRSLYDRPGIYLMRKTGAIIMPSPSPKRRRKSRKRRNGRPSWACPPSGITPILWKLGLLRNPQTALSATAVARRPIFSIQPPFTPWRILHICAQSASPTAKQPGNMTVVFKMISLWMMV